MTVARLGPDEKQDPGRDDENARRDQVDQPQAEAFTKLAAGDRSKHRAQIERG